MKCRIRRTTQFKKSFKLAVRRGKSIELFTKVITFLAEEGKLPKEFKPHLLRGTFKDIWECHLDPDWLLLWKQDDIDLILILTDTGTHSDIFKT